MGVEIILIAATNPLHFDEGATGLSEPRPAELLDKKLIISGVKL